MAGLNLHQVQKLAQTLVMTPQLQQAIKLLQLSRVELEEMVLKELQENPALEEGASDEPEVTEQPRADSKSDPTEEVAELVAPRESNTVEKMGTLEWQDYMESHANAMHSSLTAEAMSDDGDSPPSLSLIHISE